MSDVNAELVLLRAFYSAWTDLHSLPRDILHRRRQEEAAQDMVDAHKTLKGFYTQFAKPKLALVPTESVPGYPTISGHSYLCDATAGGKCDCSQAEIGSDFDKAAEARRAHLGFMEKVNG